MTTNRHLRTVGRGLLYGTGIAVGVYAALAGTTWLRYGRVPIRSAQDSDAYLDRFMPRYEVLERHEQPVKAAPAIVFAALCGVDFQRSAVIRAIFKGRELALGSEPDDGSRPHGLLAFTKSIGWGVLAEEPGREIVMGGVTQPWLPNPVFRSLPPGEFAAFDEPDFVKIVWTLRVDAIGPSESIARTETRVITTDADARRKFRNYWSMVAPGTDLIRRMALRLVKREAERQARS